VRESTGLCPCVRAYAAGNGVVSQAGAVLLLDTIRAAGLDRGLSRALEPWRKPTALHDPAKILLDVVVSLAVGGDCLADIAVLRAAPAIFGGVASDPTVSRLISTLAGDADRASTAIEAARAAARREVWRRAGAAAPDHDADHRRPLIVDVDATLVTAHSEKEQAAATFKRGYGHHPVRREALLVRAGVRDRRHRLCRSRAVKLGTAWSGRCRGGREQS
jgi:Transposase DDE domain group 1